MRRRRWRAWSEIHPGAVLPGVTVEAASPALIEKVRTAVTDGNGRFQIIDLRPGTYTVTFTLPGFNTVKRDGIELGGSGTSSVDAELRVGALEETITVTGEAATVDTSSTTRQLVLDRETVQLVPSGRNYYNLGAMVVGVNSNSNDVGGALGDTMSSSDRARQQEHRPAHHQQRRRHHDAAGGRQHRRRDAGRELGAGNHDRHLVGVGRDVHRRRAHQPDPARRRQHVGELQFPVVLEREHAGRQPDGSSHRSGLAAPAKNIKIWDINPAVGGPIVQDKAWFWFSGRYQGTENQPTNAFVNRNAWNPNAWLLDLDTTQPTANKGVWHSLQIRGTIQASQRNKFAFTWQEQNYCRCPNAISATRTLEAADDRRFPRLQQQHAEWTSPVTSRLLIEAVGMHLFERWGNMHPRSGEGNFFITGGSYAPEEVANLPR